MTSKVWDVMNDLEMVTSKIVSAREIIDTAVEAIQKHDYDKAETLAMAAYEFLGYYLDEFDAKFKLAWQETVRRDDADKIVLRTDGEDKTPQWDLTDEKDVEYLSRPIWASLDRHGDLQKSKHYYEYDRNDLDRPNPFVKTPTTSCDSDDPSPECKGAWNDFWEGGSTVSSVPKDKVVKWRLPVHQKIEDGIDDYYVQFPDDLLEAADLKEGDKVEWIDRGDGSYLLRKVESNA